MCLSIIFNKLSLILYQALHLFYIFKSLTHLGFFFFNILLFISRALYFFDKLKASLWHELQIFCLVWFLSFFFYFWSFDIAKYFCFWACRNFKKLLLFYCSETLKFILMVWCHTSTTVQLIICWVKSPQAVY